MSKARLCSRKGWSGGCLDQISVCLYKLRVSKERFMFLMLILIGSYLIPICNFFYFSLIFFFYCLLLPLLAVIVIIIVVITIVDAATAFLFFFLLFF